MLRNVITPVFESAIYGAIKGIFDKIIYGGTAAFNPTSLFTGGFTGGFYDNSDVSTLFTTSAGTTQVAADANPTGLFLDKSKELALLPEKVVNGDFSSATGWPIGAGMAISGGKLTYTAVVLGGGAGIYQLLDAPSIDSTYCEVTIVVDSLSGGTLAVNLSGLRGPTISTAGTYTQRFLASAFGNFMRLEGDGTVTCQVDSISVKQVAGNHLPQATAAARPLYDLTALLHSSEFDGIDDFLPSLQDGGGTVAFCFMACKKITQVGVRQTLFSDAGTNAGYKVELNTSNQLVISAGDGTSYTTATTANAFTLGQTVSIEAYDDGVNIGVRLNNGTLVTAARPNVSAGTAGFTIGKDNGAASGYFKGNMYGAIYNKNKANTLTERANAITWLRTKGGV